MNSNSSLAVLNDSIIENTREEDRHNQLENENIKTD